MSMKRIMMVAVMVVGAVLCVFADAPTLSVTNVTFRQRYPWNGLVDIDCDVTCSDPTTNISLYVSAKDTAANKSLAVRNVWLASDSTHTNALEVKSGMHRLVWDAGKDNPNFVGDAVTVEVQALLGTGLYLVIDLSGGKDAASYPISYLGAEPQGGWTDEYKTTKLVLRRINSGTFMMGSPINELGRGSYEDLHQVSLTRPFFIGVFAMTQKQYSLVMGTDQSVNKGDMRPVDRVTYNLLRGTSLGSKWPITNTVDATSYMGVMRKKTGLEFDLPTEAQWEYACRAGTKTALNTGKNLSSSGTCAEMNEAGRYSGNPSDGKGGFSTRHTTVGCYMPNAWGLYDMHGGVWEWCLDWFNRRAGLGTDAVVDPRGVASSDIRCIRGGSCGYSARYCRSAYRYNANAPGSASDDDSDYCGFRLCCSVGLNDF